MADKSEIIVKIVGKIIFVEMTMPAVCQMPNLHKQEI